MLDEHMGPIKKYSILTVGAVVLALANYVFKFPNHFSFGGVAGFAVILSGMFGGSASTYTFVINMLLLLIAFPILGKEVAMRSFYVSIVFSGVLEVAQYVYLIDKTITNRCWSLYFLLCCWQCVPRYSSSWMRPAEEPILLL